MRTIKFRAWVNVPHANTMLQNIDLEELWMSGRAYEDYGTSRYEAETISGIRWTFKDLIFMQYTGIVDKNGREIYEGDIVATGFTEQHVKSIVRIGEAETSVDAYDRSFTKPYYGVYLEGSIDLEEYLLEGKMYVIGNIYENPELLSS